VCKLYVWELDYQEIKRVYIMQTIKNIKYRTNDNEKACKSRGKEESLAKVCFALSKIYSLDLLLRQFRELSKLPIPVCNDSVQVRYLRVY
jgi:hypothetical protein